MAVTVNVDLGERAYDVVVTEGAYEDLGPALASRVRARRVVLVTEETVGPLWADAAEASIRGAGLAVERVVLPAGEANKTVATWSACVDALLALGIDRRTPVVALGGGVLGDVAGFAAATVLRGVPFVQVPTTLLAMVDSSVGGKTGVNHPRGKNLVGAFHQPAYVHAALGALSTLPDDERRAGLGEVVKTALVADADLFSRLERDAEALAAGDPSTLAPVVARCVEVKARVVAADEREAGVRAVLNAGHTVGHAVETVLGHGRIRHGEAVGIGLVAEAAWAVRAGICEDPDLPGRLASLLGRLGLPSALPALPVARLVEVMRLDKKSVAGKLRVPVTSRIGQFVLVPVSHDQLPELLSEPR